MSLPSSAYGGGSVVSANRVYITLALNLPLLSQLWQRGPCQRFMYSHMLYRTSLSCLKWMDNFHGRGSEIPFKATWSCFCLREHWWKASESQWTRFFWGPISFPLGSHMPQMTLFGPFGYLIVNIWGNISVSLVTFWKICLFVFLPREDQAKSVR